MASHDPGISECCRYCPHLESVQGSCGHDLRQALLAEFRHEERPACPVFTEIRVREMSDLADHLQ